MIASVGRGAACLPLAVACVWVLGATAQDTDSRLMQVAREVMAAAGNCALITLDAAGSPQARAMDPFPPEEGLVVWMATNRDTRKVAELRLEPRSTLYYFDPEGPGFVTLHGRGRIVDDPAEKAARWKPEWREFYDEANRGDDYVLIEFVPDRAEIVSLAHGVAAEPKAWKPAVLHLR